MKNFNKSFLIVEKNKIKRPSYPLWILSKSLLPIAEHNVKFTHPNFSHCGLWW